MGAMHNVMVFDEWIEEHKDKHNFKNDDSSVVIENQVINIIINFTLDGMEYKVEKQNMFFIDFYVFLVKT